MSIQREAIIQRSIGSYTVTVYVELYGPWDFGDQFEVATCHEGGVTIRNPVNPGDDRCYQWFIPTQYSLAELSKDYAKAGRENPSREAYDSLQRQLGWELTAGDYGFCVEIRKAGVLLAETYAGFGFDYSWEYANESLDDYCRANYMNVIFEVMREAKQEARDTLQALRA